MAQEHFDQSTAEGSGEKKEPSPLAGWFDIVEFVFCRSISPAALAFYHILRWMAPPNGIWIISVSALTDRVNQETAKRSKDGWCRRSIQDYLHQLAALNLIRLEWQSSSKTYRIEILKKQPSKKSSRQEVAEVEESCQAKSCQAKSCQAKSCQVEESCRDTRQEVAEIPPNTTYSPNDAPPPSNSILTNSINTTDLNYDTKSESPTSLVGDQSVGESKPLLGGNISPAVTPTPQPTPPPKSAPPATDKDEAWRKIEVQLGKPPTLKAELFELWEQIKRNNDPLKVCPGAIKEALDEADWPFAWFAKSKFAPDAQGIPRLVKSAVKAISPPYYDLYVPPPIPENVPPLEEGKKIWADIWAQINSKLEEKNGNHQHCN